MGQYAELLFEAIVRRLADAERSFDARLGALYLLLTMYELQPTRPRTPVPVMETQWASFERLAGELRAMRLADGFRVLHALWAGGALLHCAGSHATVNAQDQQNDVDAERAARCISARLGTNKLGGCPFALQLDETLPALEALERSYDDARRAVLSLDGSDVQACSLRTTGNGAARPRRSSD